MEDEDKERKSGEKFRKAQALVVEILNLNPQDEMLRKYSNCGKETWIFICRRWRRIMKRSSTY